MKEPAEGNGGRKTSTGFGQTLARQALAKVPYLEDAVDREPNPEEAVGLAWATWGLTYAEQHALTDEGRATLGRLEAAVDAGILPISTYAAVQARRLIKAARDGDSEALRRMLEWAKREDV